MVEERHSASFPIPQPSSTISAVPARAVRTAADNFRWCLLLLCVCAKNDDVNFVTFMFSWAIVLSRLLFVFACGNVNCHGTIIQGLSRGGRWILTGCLVRRVLSGCEPHTITLPIGHGWCAKALHLPDLTRVSPPASVFLFLNCAYSHNCQ